MKDFNPIIDTGCVQERFAEVPKYVHEGRLIKLEKKKIERVKFPKTKISRQKTLTHKKISSKAFNSFIDKGHKTTLKVQPTPLKLRNSYGIMLAAEQDLKDLIELAKIVSRKDDLITADLYYGLIEFKQKELGLLYNYRKRD